jgi:hypothetical protein
MIRKDFETGGFPINRQCPVFCVSETGELFIAYNRFTLVLTLRNKPIKKCVGIWPGRFNTDCFPMHVQSYINIPLPPEEHKFIDDSSSIKIIYEKNGVDFNKISYVCEDFKGNKTEIESKDGRLKEYVIKSGLKYTVSTG